MKEKNKCDYLIFLGTKFDSPILQIEQYLPRYLSRYARVVCFDYPQFKQLFNIITGKVPLLEKRSNNLLIFHSFGLLPFGRTFLFINFINHFISFMLFSLLCNQYIDQCTVISFTPEATFITGNLKTRNIYYYVLDNYESLPWWNSALAKNQLRFLEKSFLGQAKKIIVVTQALAKKFMGKGIKVIHFPTPANTRPFATHFKNEEKPLRRLAGIRSPIIGFIGNATEWKSDLKLIRQTIDELMEVSVVFLGQMNMKDKLIKKFLLSSARVHYIGCIQPKMLPSYVSMFDVCIIPYVTDNYGRYAYPVKIMEYLSLGKPVVTTPLPSIKYLGDRHLIYWSRNKQDFINNVKLALDERKTLELLQRRVSEAKRNDWGIKIRELLYLLNT